MSIKVLMLSTGFDMGGAERQIADLSKELVAHGYEVRIVSLTPLGHLANQAVCQGVDILSVNKSKKANLSMFIQLYKLIRAWKPDILHAHLIHANILARLLGIVLRVPIVISTVHSYNEGKRWGTLAYRLTEWFVDKTVFVSRKSLQRYVQLGAVRAGKAEAISNGLDFTRYHSNQVWREELRASLQIEDHFVWLAAGRLEKVKDYATMLRAFQIARNFEPNCLLLIAGEGVLKYELQVLATELGIADHVRFLGLRQDIPEIMNAADAFILSSQFEGFGRVLVEALACELPVVSTACGGPEEILEEGELGILVPVGSVTELAQAMQNVMTTQIHHSIRENRAMSVKSTYFHERIVGQWEELYQRLLRKKGMKAPKIVYEEGKE
ncbi:glycosyltransferase [Brevibacillus daliensis]|uniref:glycosyltransferase n=1 Tax=Brevibacillus daliensis TaxID=2892995 RepID=UPI001E61DF75|nr:glycosyltransferase [Brevibacillus daliensis]